MDQGWVGRAWPGLAGYDVRGLYAHALCLMIKQPVCVRRRRPDVGSQ